MIRIYLKIAFRSLRRNKAFTIINIFGLSIGIATCLLIMLFVEHEWSYDRFNTRADRIVRVIFRGTVQGEKMKEANVMPPTARTLLKDYPEVQQATRLRMTGSPIFRYGEKSFKEDRIAYVDSNFFQVFTVPFLKGDARTALVQPNTIVLSQAMAQKYFGAEDPIGKVLSIKNNPSSFKVTGVFDKVPGNSHFHFDFFASMAGLPEAQSPSWMDSGFFTYLVLPKGYDYKKLEAKLPDVVDKYMGPQFKEGMGVTLEDFRKKGNNIGLYLQPLTDIHLHSDLSAMTEMEAPGDIRYVYIFGAVALFMLLIACINFMNLSTAGAADRAREVGIRKVLGSLRMSLVRQFLLESMLLTFIALALALILVWLALPLFNHLYGNSLSLGGIWSPWLVPGLLLFTLLVGGLAGSYPAFFLSSFKPIAVLKGRFFGGKNSIGLRSGLVVFQFFISVLLIVGTTVVYQQLSYIRHVKLGYDKDQVLVLHETWLLGKNRDAFRDQVLRDSRVENVSVSGYLPAGSSYGNNFFVYATDKAAQVKTLRYDVDYNYIPVLGMQMAAGRNFSKEFPSDSSGVILNETAAKALGWQDNALGHTVSTSHDGVVTTYRVVGIVKDFHFRSLHELISPLVMVLGNDAGTMIVKVKTKDIAGLLASVNRYWRENKAEAALAYSFLDDRLNDTYQVEEKMGLILGIFAGLTIFVACLGLFGLATFTAAQRTKEIGIRKVLGATVTNIVGLLSREFIRLVIIANLIAWPLAWWVMNLWLRDFAYRITIGVWVFLLAGTVALLVTLFTVSFQSIRSALMNPVKSLRSE